MSKPKPKPDIVSAAVTAMSPQHAIELAGGTQEKLADVMGVTRQAVVAWVHEGKIPPGQILRMVEMHPEWFKA